MQGTIESIFVRGVQNKCVLRVETPWLRFLVLSIEPVKNWHMNYHYTVAFNLRLLSIYRIMPRHQVYWSVPHMILSINCTN